MSKYNFVNSFNEGGEVDDFAPKKTFGNNMKYYQVASFPNSKSELFVIRAFDIDSENNFKNINEFQITKTQFKKFSKSCNSKYCKYYNVSSLRNVNYPTLFEVQTARSDFI
jgi:hypothetical protein